MNSLFTVLIWTVMYIWIVVGAHETAHWVMKAAISVMKTVFGLLIG